MNVLSLFDGMSGGRLALQAAGIPVTKYYSSEIDKYAIKVADKNWPQDTPHRLGSVLDLDEDYLKTLNIDLLIGGSPCQSFSFAGKRNGASTVDKLEVTTLEQYLQLKKDGFQFEGQSYLFWEYMRVMHIVKPKYFLLENVAMSKHWKDILSKAVGVEPIMINSSLVSAQNRKRLYWTNIPNIKPLQDLGIQLKDVLLNTVQTTRVEEFKPSVRDNIVREYDEIVKSTKMIYQCECTSGWQDNKVGITKSPTLRANNPFTLALTREGFIRRLTPVECEILQTVPLGYTIGVSDSQRFKLLGNGWTIDVIAHLFKPLKGIYVSD